MKRNVLSLLIALSAAVVLGGCERPPVAWEHVVPLRQVVDEYNANASRIPRLWARAKIHITFTDDKGIDKINQWRRIKTAGSARDNQGMFFRSLFPGKRYAAQFHHVQHVGV